MSSVECGYNGDPFELVQSGPRLWACTIESTEGIGILRSR